MQSEVFEAFRSLGAPEDKALKAAEALSRRYQDVGDLKGDVVVIRWMVGILYPFILAILVKLFVH